MNDMDIKAVKAASNAQLMNDFIQQNEPFVLKCTSKAVHHYVTKSDDEWSVAISAFSQAVGDYSIEKGSFSSFARLVIRRKIVDYLRSQSKCSLETPVSPSILDGNMDEEDDSVDIAIGKAVYEHMEREQDDSIKLEIEAVGMRLNTYGFSFFDLISCSPKAEKTRKACAIAVLYILHNPDIEKELKQTKMLPLGKMVKNIDVPRKILERHRKYIIAAVEIISGDYPFLAEYMRFMREEHGR